MELWVAGFNAWGQLNLSSNQQATYNDTYASDINNFQFCIRDDRINFLWAGLSATLANKSTLKQTIDRLKVETSNGIIFAGSLDQIDTMVSQDLKLCTLIAVAGNEKVTAIKNGDLQRFESVQNFRNGDGEYIDMCHDIIQIVANQTSFTALSSAGDVWTWGDSRYPSCLSRDISDDSSASKPCLVSDLLDLPTGPIQKIASGGYITAALTEGRDLYMWGGRPGQPEILGGLTNRSIPLDIEGADIIDMAVGNDHILALTFGGRLFVIGWGTNGQLGVNSEKLDHWKEVKLSLKEGQRIRRIYAGYKTSFVIVE